VDALIIDALAANDGRRRFSRDVIGAGPRLLAGIMEKNNLEVNIRRVEDFLLKQDITALESKLFLISAMSVDEIAVRKAINLIKKEKKKSTIIVGGPIVSDTNIASKLQFDIGVIGEGEIILDNLVKTDFQISSFLESEEVKTNITHQKRGETIFFKKKSHSSSEIFNVFFPSIERIKDYPDYWFSRVYVEVVRGCSNHFRGEIVQQAGGCSNCGNCDSIDTIFSSECPEDIPPGCGFCSVPHTFGGPISRKIEIIEREVKALFEKGVRRIVLSAPGFLDYYRNQDNKPIYSPTSPKVNIEKIEELLARLAKIRDQQDHICSISVENIKPALVNREVAEIFGKYLPNTSISIGCETFDEKHSSAIGRPSSPQQALNASKLLRDNKLHPQIYLIHSLPGETVNSLKKTKEVVKSSLDNIADKITVYKYLPLPNSPFTKTNSQPPSERHLLKIMRDELKEAIIAFNTKKKKEIIGKKMKVIVAEKDVKRENTFICYPIFSGSAISVYSKKNIINKDVEVEITKVISDKLVEGRLVQ